MAKIDPAIRPKRPHTPPRTAITTARGRHQEKPELKFSNVTEADEKVKVLYYGDPGTGKTTDLASMARLGPVIHVDAEAGVKAKPLRQLGVPIENIKRFRTITFHMMDQLFWKVREMIEVGEPVSGVFLDSLTEIQTKLLEDTVLTQVGKLEAQGKERSRHDIYLEDYGTNTAEMRELVRKYRDLDCHVGFSCLERRTQDQESSEVSYGPYLTPKLAGDLMGYCDVIVHTTVRESSLADEDEFVGITRPIGRHRGKDRFKVLPRRMIDPTMDRIVAYVHGALTHETDELQLEAEERWAAERAVDDSPRRRKRIR